MKIQNLLMTSFLCLVSQISMAYSGDIMKETWTCKNKSKNGHVDYVKATVDRSQKTSTALIADGAMSRSDIHLEIDKKRNFFSENPRFTASIRTGHDDMNYSLELVLDLNGDSSDLESKLTGKAFVVRSGFIDCLGNIQSSELLDCSVQVVREK